MRATRLRINDDALRHNLQRVRAIAPNSNVLAVLKAQAYGHGLLRVAQVLDDADAFAVAFLDEARYLREQGISKEIMVLQGPRSIDDVRYAKQHDLRLSIHHESQLFILNEAHQQGMTLCLNMDTGMHRLGFAPEDYSSIYAQLTAYSESDIWLMTHMACADEPEHELNQSQLQRFNQMAAQHSGSLSVANSASIVNLPDTHHDWVRPGIMLYGASPDDKSAAEHKLLPVMSLSAPVVSVKTVKAGESIGYGAAHQCEKDSRIAIVAVGYADGYPRHVPTGTAVAINNQRCSILGRVSMDMIAVDVSGIHVDTNDECELWGEIVSVNEVAQAAGTIPYELLCHAGSAHQ